MNNTTDALASEMPASLAIRLVGAVSYGLLSSCSIFMNVLLIAVLSIGHHQFRRMAFFTLAWQMIICDLMTQTVQIIVAVPVTAAGEAIYGHPFWYYAILFFDTVAYNATLHFSALLTLNRFCVFFLPALNERLFSAGTISYTITALWVYVFAYCSCWDLIGCRKSFSETGFYMYHDCPPTLSTAGTVFKEISFALSTYLPVLMLLAYVVCFIYIRYFFGTPARRHHNRIHGSSIRSLTTRDREEERMERARRRRDANFLIQSFLICGFLEVQNLAFDFLPLLASSLNGDWPFLVTFIENWISILLNTISPIILFAFNQDVRKCLHELLPFFRFAPNRLDGRMAQQQQPNRPIPAITNSYTIQPSQLMRPVGNQVQQHQQQQQRASFVSFTLSSAGRGGQNEQMGEGGMRNI